MATIKHVIVLMMENRSFDHMLGLLEHPDPSFPRIDPDDARFANPVFGAPDIKVWHGDAPYHVRKGPGHEHEDVMQQMAYALNDTPGIDMKGFASVHHHKDVGRGADVMRSYTAAQAPVIHALAKQFRVCTNWFCSVPGATWPNRFFAMTGQSASTVNNEYLKAPFAIRSLFDVLDEAGQDWRIYHDGPCLAMLLDGMLDNDRKSRYASTQQLLCDIGSGALPVFSWVEPDHFGKDSSSQHATFINEECEEWGFLSGEKLMLDIYDALRANDTLFNETTFVITYDEHGGFHDHVVPPHMARPFADHVHEEDDYRFGFEQLGPRVPALVISPHVAPGSLDDTVYDHTAIVRMVLDLCVPHDTSLGARVAASASPLAALQEGANPVAEMPVITPRVPRDKPGNWRLLLSAAADDLQLSLIKGLVRLKDVFVRDEGNRKAFALHAATLEPAIRAPMEKLVTYLNQRAELAAAPLTSSGLWSSVDKARAAHPQQVDIVDTVHELTDALLGRRQ